MGIFKANRYDFDFKVITCGFVGLEGDPANTFFQLAEPSEAFMVAFRKDYQSILILYYINCFCKYLIISLQAAESVPDSVYR